MADNTLSTAPIESSHGPNTTAEIVPDENPYATDDPKFLTDSDKASSTQSLSSSVLNYQYENGRRYHAYREGEYVMPNDEKEQDRLDLHHHIFRLTVGGALFRAPFDPSSARILDLGTGTGIWAVEMADEYPRAKVTGNDLSPIQPGWVPANCYFELGDYESSWDFSEPFDFIFGRSLAGSVKDYPRLFRRIKNNLRPGGWVEMADIATDFYSDDGTKQYAPNILRWANLHNEGGEKFGKTTNIAPNLKQWMIDAGFKNVREEVYKVPTNPWAKDPKLKELARFHLVNLQESLEAYSLALLTRVLGMSYEEVQVFFADVRKELADRSLHLYAKYYFVFGQKEV